MFFFPNQSDVTFRTALRISLNGKSTFGKHRIVQITQMINKLINFPYYLADVGFTADRTDLREYHPVRMDCVSFSRPKREICKSHLFRSKNIARSRRKWTRPPVSSFGGTYENNKNKTRRTHITVISQIIIVVLYECINNDRSQTYGISRSKSVRACLRYIIVFRGKRGKE